ncbi:TraG family conjugative transposon ATPase [Chitinophaga varians]|uniref:TraG family conjugative transposon ATPase n=1 Tax=Chitinophaga varians TaxID=2202339 RepID=UPI001CB714DA|nr:TraG family conjugative transposon ATPase [Chitinophaga varians]
MKNLEEVFPIYKIEDDYILSKSGSITIAYAVQLPEIFTLGINDYEAIHASFLKAIRTLPPHVIIHKQDWFSEARFKPDSDVEKTFLSRASDRHFNERPYLDHECYIFLSTIPDNLKEPSPLSSILIRNSIIPAASLDISRIGQFTDKVEQFAQILQDSGYLSLRRLKGDEIGSSKDQAGLLERYCFLLGRDEYPTLSDIKTGEEIKIGSRHLHVFTIADAEVLPSLCGPRTNYARYSTEKTKFSICFAGPVSLLLHCNHIYNQYIVTGQHEETINRLESKRRRLQALSKYSRENTISLTATNNFLNEAVSQGRLPIKAHFNIIAWCDDAAETRNIKNIVTGAMAEMDGKCKLETAGAATLFWAGVPGNGAELPSTSRFDTFAEQATCFFSIETNYRDSVATEGVRFGDRITGVPKAVDLFELPYKLNIINNRNVFLLGPSGTGKSFATNHILRSCWEEGAHIVIIDVGHSYTGLCSLAEGYYFAASETKPICFNPFFIQDGMLDIEKRESIKALLLALWKRTDESFSRSEYVTLSNALQGYFEFLKLNPDVFPCFDSFYDYLGNDFLPELQQQGIKDKDFDVSNFLYVLKPYYGKGEYGYLLNARENLDLLETSFIVFDLDSIASNEVVFSVTTLVIMELFISKMRRLRGKRKIILIEEAWKAIAQSGMSQYIKYLFKTVRKFWGTAFLVTQELNDIISSSIVKDSILANADIKILLDQSKFQNKFQDIQDLLGLTEKDKTLIMSMNKSNDPNLKYKEIFIALGSYSKVYRTEVSLEEYLCYSTEEKEKLLRQEYAQRYGSVKRGIARLAADLRAKTKAL